MRGTCGARVLVFVVVPTNNHAPLQICRCDKTVVASTTNMHCVGCHYAHKITNPPKSLSSLPNNMNVPLTTYSCIQPPMTMSSDNNVEIQPNDVLSGRGNATKKHLGNIYFRNLVQTAKDYYVAFPCNKKLLISQAVYDSVKSLHPPGRYLKEKDGENGGILWEEISEKEALTKTSQALRQSSHKRSGKCLMKIRDQHELDQRLNEIKVRHYSTFCCL